ncbi:MAG: hypothetical protein A2021_04650 [Elusimicrobia bacterium GWF2_52_66]|nr:MAG: hypothetical protein A2021_04650 [Elusimicrobia bacterium GWF2_52_66]
MELKKTLQKKIPRVYVLALGAGIAAFLWFGDSKITARLRIVQSDVERMEDSLETSGAVLEELRFLKELRLEDAARYKKELKGLAKSSKAVYDAGVSLQEEKRLLEKQLEIMTTYLEINEETGKISIMRGDHSLKDCPFSYSPLRLFGNGTENMPPSARVVSKERFAQPQRGKVEEIDGKISWEPPQAGKDPRSGGLGEFVIFTDSPLVIHGPPLKQELHEAYTHVCAGVTAYTAKKLFENTFIGTKILYTPAVKPMAKPAASSQPTFKKTKNRKTSAKTAAAGKKKR